MTPTLYRAVPVSERPPEIEDSYIVKFTKPENRFLSRYFRNGCFDTNYGEEIISWLEPLPAEADVSDEAIDEMALICFKESIDYGDLSEQAEKQILNAFETAAKQMRDLMAAKIEAMKERVRELEEKLNTPEVNDFIEGVKLEAAHQTERWGNEQEENNHPAHYILVNNKLLGKLTVAMWDKDKEKFKHHCITIAAAMHNLHMQIEKEGTHTNEYFSK